MKAGPAHIYHRGEPIKSAAVVLGVQHASVQNLWNGLGASPVSTATVHEYNVILNQYQGGMCISGVLKTTEGTPRYLYYL